MTQDEIKASGLLELYALGQLSPREQALVWQHIVDFPALRKDLAEIERALERVAQAAAVVAPSAVKQRILDEIARTGGTVQTTARPRSIGWSIAAAIAVLVALGLLYLLSQKNTELNTMRDRLAVVIDSCGQQNQTYLAQIESLRQLTDENNEILHMTGTPGFPQTDLYFYHNPVSQRNFIQVRDLPPIAANQSYQLWSLKPDTAPIPLDVFQGPVDQVIEVRHEANTASYAITIEPLGGRPTPTLEHLIGIVNVAG